MSNDDIRRQLGAGQGECLREPEAFTIKGSGIYATQPEPTRMAPATPWAGIVADLAEEKRTPWHDIDDVLDKLEAQGII